MIKKLYLQNVFEQTPSSGSFMQHDELTCHDNEKAEDNQFNKEQDKTINFVSN